MTSALSGTKSLTKRRVVTIGGWRSLSWDGFATFSLLYTKTPILPRLTSPLPPAIWMTFCLSPPRIHCAKSLTTVLTRHLTHDNSVSTTTSRVISHDANDNASVPSITSPDLPPSPTHPPLPVFTDVLPLDNRISVPTSTQVISRTTNEGHRIPPTSLSLVLEPSRTTQPSTSPSPNSNALATPPADIAVGHTALSHTHSDDISVRPLPSPTPVLDAILPTGLLSFQAATQSDLSFVYFSNRR